MSYNKAVIRYHVEAERLGVSYAEAETLRRAAMTLHRWGEHECNGVIQRVEGPQNDHRGRPMIEGACYTAYNIDGPGPIRYARTADRETPALARARRIADAHGLTIEYQGDPRGWPLTLKNAEGATLCPPCR